MPDTGHTPAVVAGAGQGGPAQDRAAFLSALNHEIRTPLNGIVGLARLLLDTRLDAMQRESLEVILQSGESLAGALDDLLDLARLDAGQLVLAVARFDVRRTIAGVVDLMVVGQGRGEGRSLSEVAVTVDSNVPGELSGDVIRLRRLLLGALGAAAKGEPDGSLALAVTQTPAGAEGGVVLALTFAGSEAAINAIDAAFGEGDGHSGTFVNLGLAVGRGMLRQMEGRARRLDGGRLCIDLPLRLASEVSALEATPVASKTLRLLVAEDNPINQKVAKGLLEKQGHEVVLVSTGREALAAVQSRRFDLVLMDVQMPDMDGIVATRAIRGLRGASSRVPIVALTANAFDSDRERCLAAGMNGVLGKPIQPDEVTRLIAGFIAPAEPAQGETLDSLRDIFGAQELQRLLGVLVESLESGWTEVVAALAATRLDVAAASAHKIAGAAANFGFAGLRAAARELEDAVDKGCSPRDAGNLAAVLKDEIELVKRAVEAAGSGD